MSTESYEYRAPPLSRPTRIGLGLALGVAVGSTISFLTSNFALWFPAFLGMGLALGVVLATRE